MKRNALRQSRGDRAFDINNHIIIIVLMVVMFYPLYYVLIASINDPNVTNSGQLILFPTDFNTLGFRNVFKDTRILTGYGNSIFYTICTVFLGLAMCIPCGYVLSRRDLVGRGFMTGFLVFTMYFSGGLIPTYTIVHSLKLTNSRLGIILLGSMSVYNIILIRSYFRNSLPEELREAAEIDGCSNLGFFFQIALPLATPIIAVIAMYIAEGTWNSYFNAMVYLSDIKKYPLQNFLREILLQGEMNVDLADPETAAKQAYIMQMLKYCVIVISSLPMMLLYPFIQRFFVTGMMIGSLKG